MAKKRNWDQIRKQNIKDTLKYRDVFEDQQLERSDIAEKETMLTRNILNGAICFVVFILVWFFISLVQMFFSGNGTLELSENPEANYVYVEEHYENKADGTDKISVAEYSQLLDIYVNSSTLPAIEKPYEPVKPDIDSYMFERGGYMIPNQPDTWISKEEYEGLENAYKVELEQYKADLAEYKAYVKSTTNPEETYTKVVSHYRNRNNLEEAIYVEDYEALVLDYKTLLSKGKISADSQNVPLLPFDPSTYYKADSYTDGSVYTYRNVLDGSTISYIDYDEIVNKYNQDVIKYKESYQAHRELYHADNIDGTKKTLSLGPNKWKVLISFAVSGILFSVLYMLFSRNLKAQNLMSDTSDINQYRGDQHVALPEEVQRNYDWYPDVGAHSAVQVSSMISHMALTNKGLKQVEFAKRAEKDILDEDGDVEYYKGEILNDEDGNPITTMEPLIDEQFMEDLFDASGAPKDKTIRKRYDATKIPYNPDGSNRDKLGKYETVADLINEDWELPLYEPQRPGGAYIVDTAPVNTMVLAITRAGKGKLARIV